MLKELKNQSLRNILPMTVVLILLSAGMLYFSGFGVIKLIGGPKPLDELPIAQISGAYVSYTVDLLYDSYAYTTETSDTNPKGTTVSSEYIIPVGYENGFFMGMYAEKPMIQDFDKLLESSLYYMNGESDEPGEYYEVTGTVMPMDEETLGFFHETIGYDEGDAEYQAMFQPYILKIDYLGKYDYTNTIVLTVLSAVLLLIGLYMLILALTGGYQSDVNKFCKLNGDAELNRLEEWYKSVTCIHGFRIDEKWTMFNKGPRTYILKTPNIAWIYYSVITHRRNGIKTGTTYGLILCTNESKSKIEIPMKTQDEAMEIIDYIGNHFPHIVLGYDKERESRFQKDPYGFTRTELAMMNQEQN